MIIILITIMTTSIGQVRSPGLLLSTGSDFRTIVARNFTHGRKVSVAIILFCCHNKYRLFCCHNDIDDNSLIRFGRYHSTSPPVSGFRELWCSKTRYCFFYGNFSSPIKPYIWRGFGGILRAIHHEPYPHKPSPPTSIWKSCYWNCPTPGVSPYRWALLLCANLQSARLFLTILVILVILVMRYIRCTTCIPRS